jgi:hypothetical protein
VARGLRHLQSATGPTVRLSKENWRDVISKTLANGQDINLVGASGELDYNLATEQLPGKAEVWTPNQSGGTYTVKVKFTYP